MTDKGRCILRVFLWAFGGLAAFFALALMTMPLWFNALVGGALRVYVPQLTETAFTLEHVSYNPWTGRFLVRECHLANPTGYAAREAFGVSTVDVSIVVFDLLRNRVHLKNLEVAGTYVSYLDHDSMNNFEWIVAAFFKNCEKKWGFKHRKKEKEEPSDMRFIIERLNVHGTRVQIGKLPFALPVMPLSLEGIGVEEDGLTFMQMCTAVWQQIQGAFSNVGSGIGEATGSLMEGLFGK